MKRVRKHISALLVAVFLLTGTVLQSFAITIANGQKVYNGILYGCVKGSNTSQYYTDNANFYTYTRANGARTSLRMMYVASNSAGTPILDNNGSKIYAYCIDFGVEAHNSRDMKANDVTRTDFWRNLSQTQQLGITYAQMYGFPANSLGVANCDAYTATQILIWEYQLGYRTLDGTLHNAHFYYDVIVGTPAESAYWELANMIATHKTVPSFSNSSSAPTQPMAYNQHTGRYEVWLYDYNNVLKYFSVTTNNSNVGVYQSGNDLLLYSYTPVSNVRISLNKNTIKNSTLIDSVFLCSSMMSKD
ncbi:MAG: thioester domain-containing protein [Acutalibacteraceae bacterium]